MYLFNNLSSGPEMVILHHLKLIRTVDYNHEAISTCYAVAVDSTGEICCAMRKSSVIKQE